MQRARSAYGALIRAPVFGPIARLPLRLLRWFLQPPELDPSSRADRLAAELLVLREQMSQLTQAHDALRLDHERFRLILFMISGHPEEGRSQDPRRAPSLRSQEQRPARRPVVHEADLG
ncbi:MAG: hypothetical protein ACYDD1_13665 [Caulobacteraceae bacterium]